MPTKRAQSSPTSPTKTVKLLADISRSAITWQTALERVFQSQTSVAAQAFVADLNIPREKLLRFLRTKTALSDTEVAKLLERVVPHHGMNTYKRCFGDIVERDECWYTTNGLLITDAIPVITKVIYTDTDEKYYEGYVKKGSATYEFFTPAFAVDRPGLLQYSGKLLAEYGELATFLPSWNTKALTLTLSSRPPRVVTISTNPGWNEKTREFQFQKYTLKADGAVVPAACPALCSKNPVDFPEPASAGVVDISPLLAPTNEHAALWLITATAIANMLAPPLNADPVGFVLSHDDYAKVAPQAANLGCIEKLLNDQHVAGRSGLRAVARDIKWPTFIESLREDDGAFYVHAVKELYSPIFVRVLPHTIFSAATYGWHTLNPENPIGPLPDATALKFLIPGYIQHVLRDRLVRPPGTPLSVAVLHDLGKWLTTVYGRSFNVPAVENMLSLPEQAHRLFMRDLNTAIDIGDIALLPQPRTSKQPKDYVIRNKHHWWFGKAMVQSYYKRKTGIAPNWQALLNCFARQGVLISEKEINREAGCLLQKNWCDDFRLAEKEQREKYVG